MFRRRVDFRGAGAAGNWNKNHCSGHLKGHHCRLPKSPLQKHAEKNGGRNWSPGTTHKILMHLYQSNESFLINKWTYANIATNLNSKIVPLSAWLLFTSVWTSSSILNGQSFLRCRPPVFAGDVCCCCCRDSLDPSLVSNCCRMWREEASERPFSCWIPSLAANC